MGEETGLATISQAQIMERVVVLGDLSQLTAPERISYYRQVCDSLGLNPLTKPFDYIDLNGRLVLYAKRDCTDQLRANHGVSITKLERDLSGDVYTVTAYATDHDGRSDSSIGAVALVKENGEWATAANGKKYFKGLGTYRPLPPEDRANAMMKAETKAKRRVTLSLCGLGWLDESEAGSIAGAATVVVDTETGEIVDDKNDPLAELRDSIVDVAIAVCDGDMERGLERLKNYLASKGQSEDLTTYTEKHLQSLLARVQAWEPEPATTPPDGDPVHVDEPEPAGEPETPSEPEEPVGAPKTAKRPKSLDTRIAEAILGKGLPDADVKAFELVVTGEKPWATCDDATKARFLKQITN